MITAKQEIQQSLKAKPKFFYGYIIVATSFIVSASSEGPSATFGVFFEPLLAEFGWTRALTAGAFSLGSIINIPMYIVAGRLVDRFGSRMVFTACGFFLGLGYILMSQVNAVWHLYFFYGVITAIGHGFYWIPVISTVPRWFVFRRTMMMGIVTAGVGVGQFLYPPIANWLISNYGWRLSYPIIGSISMGIIIIVAQFVRRDPQRMGLLPYGGEETKQAHQEPSSIAPRGLYLREAIRTKPFWMLCAIFFAWLVFLSIVLVHIVIHAIGTGMSPAHAASVMSVIGIMGIIGRLGYGRLADITGIKPIFIICFFFLSLDFLWLMIAREAWMIYLFAAIYGLHYGVIGTIQSPVIAELFGLSSIGTISGATMTIGSIGLLMGPILAGYIFDVTGSYQTVFLICAVLAMTALVLCLSLPLTKKKLAQS